MLTISKPTYKTRYEIIPDKGLDETIHIDVYEHKGNHLANVQLSQDDNKWTSVIAVDAKDLIDLGKSLEKLGAKNDA
ncbi:hypothetical protein NVP1253O_26 [Vibrio phage 1.253.O._10N.286.45.B12]|nr:hypothetical protein NVP1235O_26 [Vibrio phage 1.235.O._10N.261.52.B2]AUR98550.1 hypothetical protein NVP1253O_26 [Vibrio phage 1.253.O._10N.286.45.B12]